jgi:hypothetical protein
MGQAAVFNFFRIFRKKKQKEILLVLTISIELSRRASTRKATDDTDRVTFNVKINTNA